MKCPVCGDECIREAGEIINMIPSVFARCKDCRVKLLDKRLPPPREGYQEVCACGKRFLDDVFWHLYSLFRREGIFTGKESLRDVGSPLLHPGYPIASPPFLPERSLVLLSPYPDTAVARVIIDEIPEIRGVVKSGKFVPGITDTSLRKNPRTYELLAGCDVRANVFPTKMGPVVIFQQHSLIHVEFPRAHNPKICSVEDRITKLKPEWFVDACCGAGTLGLTGARWGIPHVLLNDTWYAAAFWSACNTWVNRKFFRIDDVTIHANYADMSKHPVGRKPVLIAETEGVQQIQIFQADLHSLHQVLPKEPVLAVIDLFDKSDRAAMGLMIRDWTRHVNGEAFIP
ncbi:MAG TPA: hypothetical protein PKZ57_01600 [Methanoregulaceae archaeon]|nr:hypothetical protein [Methanoregulaceae archaeon]HQM56185.1 hypothetical protein [Methanoregulaceae archaeon]